MREIERRRKSLRTTWAMALGSFALAATIVVSDIVGYVLEEDWGGLSTRLQRIGWILIALLGVALLVWFALNALMRPARRARDAFRSSGEFAVVLIAYMVESDGPGTIGLPAHPFCYLVTVTQLEMTVWNCAKSPRPLRTVPRARIAHVSFDSASSKFPQMRLDLIDPSETVIVRVADERARSLTRVDVIDVQSTVGRVAEAFAQGAL